MKKAQDTTKTVKRIDNVYVGNDCVQVMTPYKNRLTILNRNGIIYDGNKSGVLIHSYLDDDRKNQFPYSNIPIHTAKSGMFDTVTYANQLFDFGEPYIRVCDGNVIESYILKDKDGAIIVNKLLAGTPTISYVTRQEAENVFGESSTDKGKKFIIYLNDLNVGTGSLHPLASEEKINEVIKKELSSTLKDLKRFIKEMPTNEVSSYLSSHPWFLNFVEETSQDINFDELKMDIALKGGHAIIVRLDEENISAQEVEIRYVSNNKYKLITTPLSLFEYNIDVINKMYPVIGKVKNHRISLHLNPDIHKSDLKSAQQKVKKMRN